MAATIKATHCYQEENACVLPYVEHTPDRYGFSLCLNVAIRCL